MTPTQRTINKLRGQGIRCQTVEKYNAHSRKKLDLFNFIDMIAMHPDTGIIGIQITSGSNHADRLRKITGECSNDARMWLESGGRIQLWSWSQYKRKNKDGSYSKRVEWREREQEITLEDLH